MKIIVYGVVQGVGFRPAVYRVAKSLNLNGWVKNCGISVEICIDRAADLFLKRLKEALPPQARIDRVEFVEENNAANAGGFRIIPSTSDSGWDGLVPADVATCDDCVRELFDEHNRRYLYPFTNCAKCGARFAILQDLPYDRSRTAMTEFKLCEQCTSEYETSENVRFHAQTISCKADGPVFKLFNAQGEEVPATNPIKKFAELIDAGFLGVMKSWGGMHIICRLPETKRLRKLTNRPTKPFAVMARDLTTVRKLAKLPPEAEKLLTSIQRPIVLLEKNTAAEFLEDVSPGLNTVGVYLPYTSAHHLLFHFMHTDAVIMTSANPSGEPMVIDNKAAFQLGMDFYLLHNRAIVNRVDDSLIKFYNNSGFFIRKSRGYAPAAIQVGYNNVVVTVGAQENVAGSVSKNCLLYSTQYIGDCRHFETLEYLRSALERLMHLLKINSIDAVGLDLHPQYTTRRVAEELSKAFGVKLHFIQHHWAHAAALLVDLNKSPQHTMVTFTLDGTGYGPDSTLWGGEILSANLQTFERICRLEHLPLIGGESAIKDPTRLVFAIQELLHKDHIGLDKQRVEVYRKLLPKSPKTSSCGRVLDAIACRLGVCNYATYDGEPAMRLEPYLANGVCRFKFSTEVINDGKCKVVRTLPLFEQLDEYIIKETPPEQVKADLARSFVECLLKEMVNVAVDFAIKQGIEEIGLTGGVSYSNPINSILNKHITDSGLKFVLHKRVPNGDGGISVGQNAIVGWGINK